MKILFFIPALGSVVWMIVSMAAVTEYCKKRGIEINWFLYRIKFFQYINYYKETTLKETGKPGFWYYSFLGSIIVFLITGVAGIVISRALRMYL